MTIEPEFSLDQPSQINHLVPDGVLAKDRRSRSRWSRRRIIELGLCPDQSRQINHLQPAEVSAKDSVLGHKITRLEGAHRRRLTCGTIWARIPGEGEVS